MKGVIFNLLEEVVRRRHGEDTWDAFLEVAELTGSYASLGSYPDADLGRLVAAATTALGMSSREVLRWFGREAMPILAERYPLFFTAHASARNFVLSVNQIIHPEVRKIYPGADVPIFDFQDAADGALLMGYHSPRKLCALAEGFVEGAATHYSETVNVEHLACMHHGHAKCLFRLSFATGKAAVDVAA
jgi:predicted hydrocarbon binding protein